LEIEGISDDKEDEAKLVTASFGDVTCKLNSIMIPNWQEVLKKENCSSIDCSIVNHILPVSFFLWQVLL
jgi:hypothetical protein